VGSLMRCCHLGVVLELGLSTEYWRRHQLLVLLAGGCDVGGVVVRRRSCGHWTGDVRLLICLVGQVCFRRRSRRSVEASVWRRVGMAWSFWRSCASMSGVGLSSSIGSVGVGGSLSGGTISCGFPRFGCPGEDARWLPVGVALTDQMEEGVIHES
jgi:hypothetical protein